MTASEAHSGGVWPFRRNRSTTDAAKLVATLSQVARRPGFFGPGRAPDTLDGRLEILVLHGALALIRLNREPELQPLAQAFIDTLFRHVDDGLREAAVGDIAVPKRMRRIAGDFYGRLQAYEAALGDEAALAAAIGRNVAGDEASAFAPALARYAAQTSALLAAAAPAAMFDSSFWPPAPA